MSPGRYRAHGCPVKARQRARDYRPATETSVVPSCLLATIVERTGHPALAEGASRCRPCRAGARHDGRPTDPLGQDGRRRLHRLPGPGPRPRHAVVIHGWVSHLEVYWEQPRYVRFLRRLSRNLRVLVFDKRGIGMSDRMAGTPDIGVLADDVRAVMDAAGTERAALLGWGGPGPELAAFFAATHPERTLCWVHCGSLHYRREPDYPWGEPEDEYEAALAALLRQWGSEAQAREFISDGYLKAARPPVPPYNEPDFIAWNAKLARFAATPRATRPSTACGPRRTSGRFWARSRRPRPSSTARLTARKRSWLDSRRA